MSTKPKFDLLSDPRLVEQISAEQRRGRAKYGLDENDLAHDDRHTPAEWTKFICGHAVRGERAGAMGGLHAARRARERFLKVAVLAISAVQAIDRTAGEEAADGNDG